MPVAPTYNRQFNFTNYQASNPATPLPGNEVDAELSAVKGTTDAINANLNLIQRSDGQLANNSVGPQQMQAELFGGWSPSAVWSSASVFYNVGQTVFYNEKVYLCTAANTSSVGLTPDVYGAAWTLVVDYTTFTIPAGSVVSSSFAAGAVNSAALGANLALPASPSAGDNSLLIPTTAFVDAQATATVASFRNRIINGAMRIDQRHAGASGSASGYTIDRWKYTGTVADLTWGQKLGSVTPPVGFSSYLGFSTATQRATVSTDTFEVFQTIEGLDLEDIAFGTASAQPVQLSFWVYSNQTGLFSGSLRNAALNRSYVFSFTIAAANTWQFVTVAIPGDTAGTWDTSDSNGCLVVAFNLGAGSNFLAAAGAWSAGNFIGVTGGKGIVNTLNATMYLTGVQLNVGAGGAFAPFERRSIQHELSLCQRYYETQIDCVSGSTALAAFYFKSVPFAVPKRAAPTVTISQNSASGITAPLVNATATGQWSWQYTGGGGTSDNMFITWKADADF